MTAEIITGVGTILGTVVIMVLRDLRDGKSIFKKNGAYESRQTMKELLQSIKKIGDSQGQLQFHFNHETTDLLKEIRDGQRDCGKKLDLLLVKQDEMIRYGVPVRHKD